MFIIKYFIKMYVSSKKITLYAYFKGSASEIFRRVLAMVS